MMAIGPIIQVVTPAVAERMGAKRWQSGRPVAQGLFIAGAVGAVFSAVLFLVPFDRACAYGHHIAPLVRPLSVAAPSYIWEWCAAGVAWVGPDGAGDGERVAGNVARCVLIRWCQGLDGAAVAVWAMVADHVVTAVLNIACLGWFMGLAKLGLGFPRKGGAGRDSIGRSTCRSAPPDGENLRREPCLAPSVGSSRARR